MQGTLGRARGLHDIPGLSHFGCCAVGHDNEFVSLERRLVFQDAVLRDTDAE
jgi:hypothetical protein